MQLTKIKQQKVCKFHKTTVLLVSAMDNKHVLYVTYGNRTTNFRVYITSSRAGRRRIGDLGLNSDY